MTQSWLGENVAAVHAMVSYGPKGFDMHYLKKNKKKWFLRFKPKVETYAFSGQVSFFKVLFL